MVKDYPKMSEFSAIEADSGLDKVTKNLSSILGVVEDKSSCGLMFIDIMVTGRGLNALVDTGAPDLFMSEEIARELGHKIEMGSSWIKMVNSKSVSIKAVAKRVELQLGD